MNNDKRDPRVIETASGTTSSDNSNSGGIAYVITAVTIALLLVFSLGVGGCSAAIMSAAADEASSSYSYPQNYYDFDTDDYGWEEWLREYEEMYGDTTGYTTHQDEEDRTGSADVEDVLSYMITPIYGITVNSEVSASAYGNVPGSVRDYVRALVKADEDYSNTVSSLLNQASYDESLRSDNIKQALSTCDEAKASIEDMALPTIDKDENGEVADQLASAKDLVTKRWTLMHDEVALLDTSEQVDKKSLWNIDDELIETTESAAEGIEATLELAALLK